MNHLRRLAKAAETPDLIKRLRLLEEVRRTAQHEQDEVLVQLRPSEIATALNITRTAATYRRQHAHGRLTK